MAVATWPLGNRETHIHDEHEVLVRILNLLEKALEELVCYPEGYASIAGASVVRCYVHGLAEEFPKHCRREEALLDRISKVSVELDEFCQQMKREHSKLLGKFATFHRGLERREQCEDLQGAVHNLKEHGEEFVSALRQHIAVEECELSGFL